MFDSELDRAPYEPPHTEITLSNTTLLLIFFGAVLVCGLFFGFGYSMGRRGSAPPLAAEPSSSSGAENASASAPAARPMQTKRAAVSASSAGTSSANNIANNSGKSTSAASTAPSAKQGVATSVFNPAQNPKAKSSPASASKTVFANPISAPPIASATTTAAATPAIPPGGKAYQVQVAAVTRQDDADALAGALRKKGYAVETHVGTDKLFRVQMGPYATQKEAADERDKLVNDGYMAIVK